MAENGEIVNALESMSYDTGMDLAKLIAAPHRLPAPIGHNGWSQTVKAGCRLELHPLSDDFETLRSHDLARESSMRPR